VAACILSFYVYVHSHDLKEFRVF